MKTSIRILFLCLLALLSSSCGASEMSQKYARYQCIVQIDLVWGGTSVEEREGIIRSLSDLVRLQGGSQYGKPPAMAARDDGGSIYLQFRSQCERKYEMTSFLFMSAANNIEGFPGFDVLEKTVLPSSDTIDVEGKDWL